MNESQHSEPQSHRIDQFEDEIVLMDYLVVIWKWKYLILVGTFLCAVAAAVVSFQMPKVYAINTVLQPGILRVTQEGKTVYIDSAQNLKAIIETSQRSGASVIMLGIRIPTNYGSRYTSAFEGVYRELADELQIPWIEFFMESVALDKTLMQADGIHPNAEAQPILLDNAWPIVSRALADRDARH